MNGIWCDFNVKYIRKEVEFDLILICMVTTNLFAELNLVLMCTVLELESDF